MGKRKKILLIALPLVIVAIITGFFLSGQTPQAVSLPAPPLQPPSTTPTTPSTPSATSTTSTQSPETPEDLPQNLLVVPEAPLGSLAIVLACFFALLIAQRKSKSPLPLKI